MSSDRSKNTKYRNSLSGKRILYDARGERIKTSPLANKYIRFMLFWALPYIVINGIIFLLVCSSPGISIEVGDTNDYVNAEVSFTVKSLLPVKELEVTLESDPIEYEKDGSNYTCSVTQNGTFTVRATGLNGMISTSFQDVSILDDTAPSVDESSADISHGELTFSINDTQSGVDFNSIYGIVNDDETIVPDEIDKDLGLVTMKLPEDTESIELHFADMVGNARSGHITVTVDGVSASQDEETADGTQEETSEDTEEDDTEENETESAESES